MSPSILKKIWSKLADRVWAHCHSCGHGWKLYRDDHFICPYCSNAPEEVSLTGAGTFVHLLEEQPSWSAWKRH